MAKLKEGIAIVVGKQTAEGTILASVRDSTIVANTDDGSALSGGEALGILIRDESLTLDFDRIEDESPDQSGTFTKTPGSFLSEEASAFSFDVTVKGSGQTVTPAAGEYDLPEAIEVLGGGAGFQLTSAKADHSPYRLQSSGLDFLTLKVWRRDIAYTIQDCQVASISYALTPKGVTVATYNILGGAVVKRDPDTFPTSVDYGFQLDTQAPVLKGAAAQIGSVLRGFLDGVILFDNLVSRFPDSNAATGEAVETSGRRITWAGRFYVDSAVEGQDFANLIRATDPVDNLFFQIGVRNSSAGGIANALRFKLYKMNFTKVAHSEEGGRVIYTLEGYVTKQNYSPTNFVDGDVSIANDEITETSHQYHTGDGPFQLTTTDTLPAGLALATDYWIIRVDANTFKFASSLANALDGVDVDITAAAGGGTHTVAGNVTSGDNEFEIDSV